MRLRSWVLTAVAVASTNFVAADAPSFVDQSNNAYWDDVTQQKTVVPSHQQDNGFRVLTDERFQEYAVRIKEPTSCEKGIQYSGYIDNLETDDHYFFYFFESRQSPLTDPLLLWLNGGPGCSSLLGLWMELGPCLVSPSGNETFYNDYSWNTAANLLFLDQPINVGYSYGKSKVYDSTEAAKNVYAFLQIFLGEFRQYANNLFHLSGESFGGHYLPAISSQIIRQNKNARANGHLIINYATMLIGNGFTEPRTQFEHSHEYACGFDSPYKPVFDYETCEEMKYNTAVCKKLLDGCYAASGGPFSGVRCAPAGLYCGLNIWGLMDDTDRNPYDISRKCFNGPRGECYEEEYAIGVYANREDVRQNIGTSTSARYNVCNKRVQVRFFATGEIAKDFSPLVVETLEAGVRVLVYHGDLDYMCDWIGGKTWVMNMSWSGQNGFVETVDETWIPRSSEVPAGEVRSYGGLTFLRVYDAGHMVPYDKPAEALDFLIRWLSDKTLTSLDSKTAIDLI